MQSNSLTTLIFEIYDKNKKKKGEKKNNTLWIPITSGKLQKVAANLNLQFCFASLVFSHTFSATK